MKRKNSTKRERENTKKKPMTEHILIDSDSPLEKDSGTPLRSVLCVKSNLNLKEIEEREDCFILDFDQCGDTVMNAHKDFVDADLSVIGEKGKVACRDYPHSRHLCVKNKFKSTPHQNYCEQCYCFVCDVAAPCIFWTGSRHCDAIDNEVWKSLRKSMRTIKGKY